MLVTLVRELGAQLCLPLPPDTFNPSDSTGEETRQNLQSMTKTQAQMYVISKNKGKSMDKNYNLETPNQLVTVDRLTCT